MDLSTILGWSLTLLTITGLVIFFRVRRIRRDRKTLAPLLAYAKDNGTEISCYDVWDKTLIGIDNKEINRLFFIRSLPGREIRRIIHISEVAGCRVSLTERKVIYNDHPVNVVDRIELVFTMKNRKPDIVLEFYNTDHDLLTLSGELQMAQKWTGMLKTIMAANQEREKGQQIEEWINEKAYTGQKRIKRTTEKAHAF